MRFRVLYLVGLTGLFLAACGTVAEPRAAFEATNTALPRATNVSDEETEEVPREAADDEETRAAPSATATPLPTTAPSATPLPPTATPTEEVTAEATEPTEEASAEETAPSEEAEGVMVNGILGDAEAGSFYFHNTANQTTAQMCVTCHNPDEAVTGLGPYLYGIADHAGERREGYTAVEYLLESITEPRAFLAPTQLNPDGEEVEWNPELMPDDWAQVFDETALADLVAYLMTLHE